MYGFFALQSAISIPNVRESIVAYESNVAESSWRSKHQGLVCIPEFVAELIFLGTGNAFSPPGRMHSLALLDGEILIDAPPTVIPQLRRAGVNPSQLKHLLFTHWHADHTFGFPFLMLDREKMGPLDGYDGVLEVHCRPGGRELLSGLCNTGFPGSLDGILSEGIKWNKSESGGLDGTDWSFERFPVIHSPETDPHGYSLAHRSGIRILHCGDSGPCQEIEDRASESEIVILEMGVPDFVESPFHHNPSDVISFSRRHPEIRTMVTHNYSKSPESKQGFDIPDLPDEIVQLNDGDSIIIENDCSISVKKA
ncbi:MAG: hypothetical protein CMB67_03895 [Euryarchaeota archaeon]|nr:hypothetical protein [Euryarchaeota archaeon]